VTKVQEYFHTDWSGMTGTDWFGFLLTVFVFIVMVVVYFWVLNPKNKDSIEAHRSMLIDEDEGKSEKQDGRE
tara:strand:- start:108190 stop:108405 length:216 start_codon:yes stop_codon:yes gene_type:complete